MWIQLIDGLQLSWSNGNPTASNHGVAGLPLAVLVALTPKYSASRSFFLCAPCRLQKTTRLCILDSDLVVSERSIQGEERTDAADAKKDAIGKVGFAARSRAIYLLPLFPQREVPGCGCMCLLCL